MRIDHARRAASSPSGPLSHQAASLLVLVGLALAVTFGMFVRQPGGIADWFRRARPLLRTPAAVLQAWQARAKLPVFILDLAFTDYQILVATQERAVEVGVHVPTLDDTVAATVILADGEHRPAEARLPGGPMAAADRWPIEVRPEGASSWTQLIPVDATTAVAAWQQAGYLEALRREGFAAADQVVVRLRLNGRDLGRYAMVTPVGAGLQVGLDPLGLWKALAAGEDPPGHGFRYATVAVEGDIVTDPSWMAARTAVDRTLFFRATPTQVGTTSTQVGATSTQVGTTPLSAVSDPQTLGRFLALTALWTGKSTPDWPSFRWRYDVATEQLEPVGVAQSWFYPIPVPEGYFDDPYVQVALAQALIELSGTEYLEQLRHDESLDLAHRWRLLGPAGSETPWKQLEAHQRAMRARLTPERPAAARLIAEDGRYILVIANLQPFPLAIVGLDAGGSGMQGLDPTWVVLEDRSHLLPSGPDLVLRAAREPLLQAVHLQLPSDVTGAGGDTLTLVCRLWQVPGSELRVPVDDVAHVGEETP